MVTNEKVVPGIYRHFKGNLYEVLGVSKHSETGEELVIYKDLVGAKQMWARPIEKFLLPVEKCGYTFDRFTKIDDLSETRDYKNEKTVSDN